MFQDNQGGIVRDPQASPEAQILVDRPRKEVGELSLTDKNGVITISTARIQIEMDKRTSLFKITDKIRQKVVVESARPVDFMEKQVCLSLKAHNNEYFYGGGVQNGAHLEIRVDDLCRFVCQCRSYHQMMQCLEFQPCLCIRRFALIIRFFASGLRCCIVGKAQCPVTTQHVHLVHGDPVFDLIAVTLEHCAGIAQIEIDQLPVCPAAIGRG